MVTLLHKGQSFDRESSEAIYKDDTFCQSITLWTNTRQATSMEDRRIRADIIELYKIIHGLSTVEFNCFFERRHYDRTRGHSL